MNVLDMKKWKGAWNNNSFIEDIKTKNLHTKKNAAIPESCMMIEKKCEALTEINNNIWLKISQAKQKVLITQKKEQDYNFLSC